MRCCFFELLVFELEFLACPHFGSDIWSIIFLSNLRSLYSKNTSNLPILVSNLNYIIKNIFGRSFQIILTPNLVSDTLSVCFAAQFCLERRVRPKHASLKLKIWTWPSDSSVWLADKMGRQWRPPPKLINDSWIGPVIN